jgi:hypothetical protein
MDADLLLVEPFPCLLVQGRTRPAGRPRCWRTSIASTGSLIKGLDDRVAKRDAADGACIQSIRRDIPHPVAQSEGAVQEQGNAGDDIPLSVPGWKRSFIALRRSSSRPPRAEAGKVTSLPAPSAASFRIISLRRRRSCPGQQSWHSRQVRIDKGSRTPRSGPAPRRRPIGPV